jgi:hypothetical protein
VHLGDRFGDGYKLSITVMNTTEGALGTTRAFVRDEVCAGAVETSCQGHALTYMLPRQGVDVAGLFQVRGYAAEQHDRPHRVVVVGILIVG